MTSLAVRLLTLALLLLHCVCGSVLSGGLAGHVHGTGPYDVTSTGEPPDWRPYIWDALRHPSGGQMQHLGRFELSEGDGHQQLELASADLVPRRAPGAVEDGLDGWAFMMRTADRELALLCFERKAVAPRVRGLEPGFSCSNRPTGAIATRSRTSSNGVRERFGRLSCSPFLGGLR